MRNKYFKIVVNKSNKFLFTSKVFLFVQQSDVDEGSGDDDEDNSNDVYGITTVINLTDKQVSVHS